MTPDQALRDVWLVWAISWFVAARWTARTTKRAGVSVHLAYQLPIAAGALAMFAARRSLPPLWRVSSTVGWWLTCVALLGFAFTWWARVHLGTLWSGLVARKAGHRVVDDGPYAIVRHPIYSGILLAIAATAAQLGTVPAVAGAAIVAAGLYLKATIEERFLRGELGAEAYDQYARRVPMLLPRLRR